MVRARTRFEKLLALVLIVRSSVPRYHRACGVFLLSIFLVAVFPSSIFSDQFQTANEGGGFQPNHAFLNGTGSDSISALSGALELPIPIGPTLKAGGGLELALQLNYSSKIWSSGLTGPDISVFFKRRGPFGVGWRMHLGRIYESCRNACGGLQPNIVYESPDGAQHSILEGQSASGQPYEGIAAPLFIRSERITGGWKLHMGNGVVYTLDHTMAAGGDHFHDNYVDDWSDDFRGYYTSKIEKYDRDGHVIGRISVVYGQASAPPSSQDIGTSHCIERIDFLAPANPDPNTLSVQRSIIFNNLTHLGTQLVPGGYTSSIDFPAVSGSAATTSRYSFSYHPQLQDLIYHPNPSNAAYNKSRDDQLLLTRIEYPFPDYQGQSHKSLYPATFEYDLNSSDGVTGELVQRTIPTGAVIRYQYQTYEYFSTFENTYVREITKKSVFLNPNSPPSPDPVDPSLNPATTNPGGVWSYRRVRTSGLSMYAVVTDPFGNDTVYATLEEWDPTLPPGSAPIVHVYQGTAPSPYGTGSGTLLRSFYTIYKDGKYPQEEWTVYHDMGGRVSGIRRSLPGSFGHFGRIQEFDYTDPAPNGRIPLDAVPFRETLSSYDEALPTSSTRWNLWFIHKLDEQVVRDSAGVASRRIARLYGDDGRVTRDTSYIYPAGAPNDPNAVVSTNIDYDLATGVRTRQYSTTTGNPLVYGTRYEYLDNVFVNRTWYLNPTDANSPSPFPYPKTFTSIEPISGTTLATTDTTGIQTSVLVDSIGRVNQFARLDPNPPAGSLTESPTVVTYPTIHQTVVKRSITDSNYTQLRYFYDTLGRIIEVRRRTETGCEAIQQTKYDIIGRSYFVSQWGFDPACQAAQTLGQAAFDPNIGDSMEYWVGTPKQYDALGRIRRVRTPDSHFTTVSYTGQETTVTVDSIGGSPATTRYKHNGFGKLVYVDTPQGADATYDFDVLGQLTRAVLTDPASGSPHVPQPRFYTYDGLGRTLTSTNPENGTVRITKYDAESRALESFDSEGIRFTFTYDAAGRIREQYALRPGQNPNNLGQLLAEFRYDESSAVHGQGQLTRIDSYDDSGALLSQKRLSYGGLNARLSEETLTFALWDGRSGIAAGYDRDFRTCYWQNALGDVTELRYPDSAPCVSGTAPPNIARLLSSYQNGALVSVRDANRKDLAAPSGTFEQLLLSSAVYTAAGTVRRLTYGNGTVNDIIPDVMHRPASIQALGPAGPTLFTTGQHTYDGAGNVTQIGPSDPGNASNTTDVFQYDLLSRLTSATIHYTDQTGHHVQSLGYQYDPFSNLTQESRVADGALPQISYLPVDSRTNRLQAYGGVSTLFDQRGNLLGDTASNGYLFDQRNRLSVAWSGPEKAPLARYDYDAAGLRIMTLRPASGHRTFYVRDTSGNVLTEFDVPPNKSDEAVQRDYFYVHGRSIGMTHEEAPPPVTAVWSGMSYEYIEGEFGGSAIATMTLQWLPNSTQGASHYRIYRKKGTTGSWSLRASVTATTGIMTFSESLYGTGSDPTDRYYYRINSYDQATTLEGIGSRVVRFNVATPLTPTPPPSATVESRERSVTLRWARSTEDNGFANQQSDPLGTFLGYRVYRQDPNGSQCPNPNPWVEQTTVPLTEPLYHDLAVNPSLTSAYCYMVSSVDMSGLVSSGSNAWAGDPGDYSPPSPPTGLRAISGPGAGEITLVWNKSVEGDVSGYTVYRKDGSAYTPYPTTVPTQEPSVTVRYTVQGLSSGQVYTFAVAARAGTMYSTPSAEASGRPRTAALPIPEQQALRTLSWLNVAHPEISWSAVSGASSYNIYRFPDGGSWIDAWKVSSQSTNTPFVDGSSTGAYDPCRAYAYVIRAADASSDESADPNLMPFVQPIIRPVTPGAQGNGSTTITITWGGFIGCPSLGPGVTINSWTLRNTVGGQVDPNLSLPASATSHTFTVTNPSAKFAFALRANLTNANHVDDPNIHYFDSFISEDICASAALGMTGSELDCPDLSNNNPPPGTPGGPGTPEPDPGPYKLLRRAMAIAPIPFVVAPFEEAMVSQERSPEVAPVLTLATTAQHTLAPPGLRERDRADLSPHRVIGQASQRPIRYNFFHLDHLGSVRVISGFSGTKLAESKFMPFGEELVLSSGRKGSRLFANHEHDSETSLDYMRFRYYMQAGRRFLSPDPLDILQSPPDSDDLIAATSRPSRVNRYTYAWQSPIAYMDPDGMKATPSSAQDRFFTAMDQALAIVSTHLSSLNSQIMQLDTKIHNKRQKADPGTISKKVEALMQKRAELQAQAFIWTVMQQTLDAIYDQANSGGWSVVVENLENLLNITIPGTTPQFSGPIGALKRQLTIALEAAKEMASIRAGVINPPTVGSPGSTSGYGGSGGSGYAPGGCVGGGGGGGYGPRARP